jgi:hypothetical protein
MRNIMFKKNHCTHIEDLSAVGNELSEEHLRLVVGGMLSTTFAARPTYRDEMVIDGCIPDR